MAHTNLNLSSNYKRLSDLNDYKVEPGDPDPRGWPVTAPDGSVLGEVEDLVVDTTAMKVRYLVVDLEREHEFFRDRPEGSVLVGADEVDVRDDAHTVVARNFNANFGATAAYAAAPGREHDRADTTNRDQRTLTRSEEELRIGKREVSRGEARIAKHVETEHVREPVTRRREELVVERRPVEAGARGDASISEDEVRIPLMEEEVIVEKRPVVKEELVVGKRIVEERDVVEADVRREEFDVDTDRTAGSTSQERMRGSRRDER